MKSWNEIRKAATALSKRWKDAYDEKSQAQSFMKLVPGIPEPEVVAHLFQALCRKS